MPEAAPAYVTVEELLRARLSATIGGWRGALEAALPTAAFVVLWTVTSEVRPSIIAAVVALVVLAVLRAARHETQRFILYAALGVAIAAFFALRSGRGEDAFLPGMIQTAALGLAMLVANLVRWPLFGFLIAAADPELAEASDRLKKGTGSPEDEAYLTSAFVTWRQHAGIVAVASRVGWVIVVLDVIRLAVMVPLYLAGDVAALGVAKIVLGWPAYLAAVFVIGLILVRGETPLDERDQPGRLEQAD